MIDIDKINKKHKLQKSFFHKGEVELGCIVQANSLLFKKDTLNCPAVIIYTGDKKVFMTTTVIHREHIPNGYLDRKIYSVLTIDNNKADAIILPKWYWEK